MMLASVALVVATTILIKMGRLRWVWVTLLPTVWLVLVTMTASYQKIFHPNPRIGFLAYANQLAAELASKAIPPERVAETGRLIFNQRLDAGVTMALAAMVLILLFEAVSEWYLILSKQKVDKLHEAPYVATRWAEGD
jgi:carbon starvation protein